MYREASGTSGMTAAMNGTINLSMPDGWVPEFAADKQNAFVIETLSDQSAPEEVDRFENNALMTLLEREVLPMYYNDQKKWVEILDNSAKSVIPGFESARMAQEYYENLYKS